MKLVKQLILTPAEPPAPLMDRVRGWLRANPALVVALAVGALFVAAPWPFAQKAHAFLHGLCAQRFSHSFLFNGQALPFDARMTGIYGGFLITFLYLLLMGRARAWNLPSRPVTALLVLFVVALAIDGTNSTLRDFGIWYPYEPANWLRLVTGLLTGISLAALLCYLLATTLWKHGDWQAATVRDVPEVGILVALQVPFALAVVSGMGILYTPISIMLILAAIGVFVAMALAVVTMLRRRDQTYRTNAELQWPLAASLVVALVMIWALAGGRFLLEWWIGIPPML